MAKRYSVSSRAYQHRTRQTDNLCYDTSCQKGGDAELESLRKEWLLGSTEYPGLVLVSHRGPGTSGEPPAGGLASALATGGSDYGVHWLHAGDTKVLTFGHAGVSRGVEIPATEARPFYEGFSNRFFWFLAHGMLPDGVTAAKAQQWYWTGYRPANLRFARAAAREWSQMALHGLGPERAAIWVHDYHFMRLPAELRAQVDHPQLRVGFFLHVPWPELATWRAVQGAPLPNLLRGMLGSDLIGFQTAADASAFLSTIAATLPGIAVPEGPEGRILLPDGRPVDVGVFPISVDVAKLRQRLTRPEARMWRHRLAAPPGVQTVVRVDRLDPAKNLLAGFEAFGRMLARRSVTARPVRFLAFFVPSRQSVPEYRKYARLVERSIENLRRRFPGSSGTGPVTVFFQNDLDAALAGLSLADAVLVNSLRDGMNLVAKEAVAVGERAPAIVLSRRAGAAIDLGRGALLIDPQDVEETADALELGLAMPREERERRRRSMLAAIDEYPLSRWWDDQVSRLYLRPSEPLLAPFGA